MRGHLTLSILLITTCGCSKLLQKTDEATADAAAASTATATASVATASASASSSAVAKAAQPSVKAADSASGKHALVASSTTDRVPRNRDKDGPCPANFAEQPGVENHSVCARVCHTEADCHGHTCEDSDIGNGKVCTDTASKKAAAPKCKPNQIEDGTDCLNPCTQDKDCGKNGHCESMKVANPNGGTSTAMVCR
ncbi:MAG TPA: hypothetical protein VIF62_00555 [Labilithrix sp.]